MSDLLLSKLKEIRDRVTVGSGIKTGATLAARVVHAYADSTSAYHLGDIYKHRCLQRCPGLSW